MSPWKEKTVLLLRNKKIRYTVLSLVVLGLVWLSLRPKPQIVEIGVIQKGSFESSVREEGITRVIDRFTVFASADGILRRVEKSVGEPIAKGEIVAIIDQDMVRRIHSPTSGSVLGIHRESAGPIAMGSPILDVGDTSKMEIVSAILTSEIPKIKPGNAVEVLGWGDTVLPGKVKRIEPSAFTKVSSLGVEEQRVRVIVEFSPPTGMGEGFQLECKIITKYLEDQILIPTSAIFRSGDEWFTFRVVNQTAQLTPIELLDRSGNFAIVGKGIVPGDQVILYPGEWIRDGVKVVFD